MLDSWFYFRDLMFNLQMLLSGVKRLYWKMSEKTLLRSSSSTKNTVQALSFMLLELINHSRGKSNIVDGSC
ncbi:hypothetical protein Pfo_006356 [Paulownia fortunei]|nr:hypothetical protein Pfo_006356 [Paulownia fortunei]